MTDNKEDKFFYFPMISMPCTGYRGEIGTDYCGFAPLLARRLL